MKRWSSWIALAVLATASLALVAAIARIDAGGGFEARCTARGGHVIEETFDDGQLTAPGARGPVPIGYPTTQKCIGKFGEVLGVR